MPIPPEILAMDVGSGTQDILIFQEGKPVENCPQLVLPSPTSIIAQRIMRATKRKETLYLTGNLMGGGPSAWAVDGHLRSGLKVYASPAAALTFSDDLERVRAMGIRVTGRSPRGAKEIRLGDVDLPALGKALR
ncbi:MAG TPA: DUF1786 family protein, partial [Thermodesulfobacteriota bacterium]|nr:DUF1786 family protein [Thermodesulfobacteriota bacterium]